MDAVRGFRHPNIVTAKFRTAGTMESVPLASNLLLKQGAVFIMWRENHSFTHKGLEILCMDKSNAYGNRRDFRESEPKAVFHCSHAAVLYAERLLEAFSEDRLHGRILIEMDIVIGAYGTKIGKGCEIILPLVSYHTGVPGVKVGVVL
jgi:hypothetical protein